MKKIFTLISFAIAFGAFSQPNFNANTTVPVYKGAYYYGSNMGYFGGWADEQLAEIASGNPAKNIAGVGVKSLRATLPDYFVQQWGYNVRLDAF